LFESRNEFGLAPKVDAARTSAAFYSPGAIIDAEILQPEHPIFYGYDKKTIPVRYGGGPLLSVQSGNNPFADGPPPPGPPPVPPAARRIRGVLSMASNSRWRSISHALESPTGTLSAPSS